VPAALPYLFSAFKVAAALSLIGAIVKEYFGGPQDRLGQYITLKAGLFQFEEAWSAIVLASAFGIALYAAIVVVERRVMPWHVSVRGADDRRPGGRTGFGGSRRRGRGPLRGPDTRGGNR
jgi:NitT/TauT family transport system permease protein